MSEAPNMVRLVTDVVVREGSACLDEVTTALVVFPRQKIRWALKNAQTAGLIHCKGRGPRPVPYYPGPKAAGDRVAAPRKLRGMFPEAEQIFRPPTSVWDLARAKQTVEDWPPAGEGRAFMLLSAGDVEDAHEECA